jgi:hypothetical protein
MTEAFRPNEEIDLPVCKSIAKREVERDPMKTWDCSCGNVNGDRSMLVLGYVYLISLRLDVAVKKPQLTVVP